MVSDEALKKLQEQIAAWPMAQRFVVQQLIEDYLRNREDVRAYEAAGLTAEEVSTMVKDWNDLCTIVGECGGITRVKALAEADKDGRLVVLPCKVGDTVYFALLGRIIEKQVFSIVAFSNSTRIYCGGTSEYFRPEDIGKTFFLTREEAEAALEAMNNG